MGSFRGNSSGSPSEEELQVLMDQRKRKRMESNRESARRSRIRKQQRLDDLTAQIAQLSKENYQIMNSINITTQHCLSVEAENAVLRSQMVELTQRLESQNEILNFMNTRSGGFENDHNTSMNPLNFVFVNQSIMASADIFDY